MITSHVFASMVIANTVQTLRNQSVVANIGREKTVLYKGKKINVKF